ncbi:MAG: HNH endonuclease [Ruminococcus sp.]|nr:HNH endonuclease [Ruminococcus sp.]
MNIYAKVDHDDVKAFRLTSDAIKEYADKLDSSFELIELMTRSVSVTINDLDSYSHKLENAKKTVDNEQDRIRERLRALEDECEEIEDSIDDVKSDLQCTDKTITMTDSEGEEFEETNPEYTKLMDKLQDLEDDLDNVESKLSDTRSELNRVIYLRDEIIEQDRLARNAVDLLDDCKRKVNRSLNELRNYSANIRESSTSAVDTLIQIEKTIEEYRKIKIRLNPAQISPLDYSSFTTDRTISSPLINVEKITININNKEAHNASAMTLKKQNDPAANEHEHTKVDQNGHICEFEGRTYGGKYNSYDERLSYTPKDNSVYGYYESERGESKFIPSSKTVEGIEIIAILSNYDLDGIIYRNAEPDFEVCSEAVVEIDDMTENRYDYLKGSVKKPGNFSQADIKLAKKWSDEKKNSKRDWTPSDVRTYRQSNRLTWHEKCDTKTMVMVRREINEYFKHIGGVSECRVRDGGIKDGGFDD